ncbi:MAG: TIGR03936 family radical SAM-associated protein [Chloroflexi bacterium]|nr:TIGR03936 family radical SAM-associated protein [Chloroflexota bacterium]
MSRRIRLVVSRGEEGKYLSHLDVMRLWIRACRRAGLHLKYSDGFTPRPKITIAAPLPVGVMAKSDYVEIECEELPRTVLSLLPSFLPAGFTVSGAIEIDKEAPALQALVQSAEYDVQVLCNFSQAQIQQRVDDFMVCEQVLFRKNKDGNIKEFNIRAQVHDVKIHSIQNDILHLSCCLQCSGEGAGRADELCLALGLPKPVHIVRTCLNLQSH